MLGKMIAYQKEIEELINNQPRDINWLREVEYFNTKLTHLQHERLFHLLVTLSVGLSSLVSCFIAMIFQSLAIYIFTLLLMVLFAAYLIYYRKLENTVQNWYPLLDQLKKKSSEQIK